jgi:tetratricopeptide (TPR) repeat protein
MTPTAAEPFMPAEGAAVLENLAFDLAREASELSAQLHPVVRLAVAELVRSMNCYYSNLIEGHHTHPRDIDRALAADYSSDAHRRDLQLEARAHVEVQRMIDDRLHELPRPSAASAFTEWTHREFCQRLPESLLVAENPDTGERISVVPGRLRSRTVAVGRHVAPAPEDLKPFMLRFEQAYASSRLTKTRQVIAVAAAHHAGRLAVVRETAGYAAYRAGHYEIALKELRAAHRISGDVSMWPVMADCERGLGNPLKALNLAGSTEVKRLDKPEEIEMRIVASGARRDLGEFDAAVVTLQCKELKNESEEWALRLRYAYADALAAAGRKDESREWFAKCATLDIDELTDAQERSE